MSVDFPAPSVPSNVIKIPGCFLFPERTLKAYVDFNKASSLTRSAVLVAADWNPAEAVARVGVVEWVVVALHLRVLAVAVVPPVEAVVRFDHGPHVPVPRRDRAAHCH